MSTGKGRVVATRHVTYPLSVSTLSGGRSAFQAAWDQGDCLPRADELPSTIEEGVLLVVGWQVVSFVTLIVRFLDENIALFFIFLLTL
jgi:hypothetical protein